VRPDVGASDDEMDNKATGLMYRKVIPDAERSTPLNETSTATTPAEILLGDLQVNFDDDMTDCKGTKDPPKEQNA